MDFVLSDYLENKLISHITGTDFNPTRPTSVWVGLCQNAPTDAGAVEVSYTGYARKQINFGVPANRAITQLGTVTFDQCTSGSATAGYYALFDAQPVGNGNLLAYGQLLNPKSISAGNTPSIAAGQIILSFPANYISTYLAHNLFNIAFRNTAFPVPPNRCIALSTSAITDTMTGTELVAFEPNVAQNYVRKTTGSWTVSNNQASNTSDEPFTSPSGSWGTITAVALCDAATNGNILFYDNTPTGDGQQPGAGDTVKFSAGQYLISLS